MIRTPLISVSSIDFSLCELRLFRSISARHMPIARDELATHHSPLSPVESALPKMSIRKGCSSRVSNGSRGNSLHNRRLELTPLEYADPRNRLLTPLECALTKTKDLKSFRMNTYKKRGEGGSFGPFSQKAFRFNRPSSLPAHRANLSVARKAPNVPEWMAAP